MQGQAVQRERGAHTKGTVCWEGDRARAGPPWVGYRQAAEEPRGYMWAGGGPPGPGRAAVRPATLAWLACTCTEVMSVWLSVWLCFPNCVLLLCRGFPVHTRLADAAREPHTHLHRR